MNTASPGVGMNTYSNMRNVISGSISLLNNLSTKHENHKHKDPTHTFEEKWGSSQLQQYLLISEQLEQF